MNPLELHPNYPRGGKSLLNIFYAFGPKQMQAWLESKGVDLHTERDGRMFPKTNSSQTIIDAFTQTAEQLGIKTRRSQIVKSLEKTGKGFIIHCRDTKLFSSKIILATGSSPLGHEIAASFGHKLTDFAPSLFTLKSSHPLIKNLSGISQQDAAIELKTESKSFTFRGPLLITHWGFSGPAVLKLSSFAALELKKNNYSGTLKIDWFPDLGLQDLTAILQASKKIFPKKILRNIFPFAIAKKLWLRFLELEDMEECKLCELSNNRLAQLAMQLKQGEYAFAGKGEFKEEFVTCGGVDLKELNLKSFESKLAPGLYFAGEILNIDGITGGFNFQNAWSTARAAARSIASV